MVHALDDPVLADEQVAGFAVGIVDDGVEEGIAKKRYAAGTWGGPTFFVGYLGSAWDSDEWAFEVAFWDAIGPGYGAGPAFDVASARIFGHPFGASWWGSYAYTGRAGPLPTGCDRCL